MPHACPLVCPPTFRAQFLPSHTPKRTFDIPLISHCPLRFPQPSALYPKLLRCLLSCISGSPRFTPTCHTVQGRSPPIPNGDGPVPDTSVHTDTKSTIAFPKRGERKNSVRHPQTHTCPLGSVFLSRNAPATCSFANLINALFVFLFVWCLGYIWHSQA